MIVGCYSLHLYCDHPSHELDLQLGDFEAWEKVRLYSPGEYTGIDEANVFRQARKEGWLIKRKDGIALCPIHSGKRK